MFEEERGGPFEGPVERAAAALVAVGALTTELADAVISDYALAGALRGRHRGRAMAMRARRRSTATAEPLAAAQALARPVTVEIPWGEVTVMWVRFGDHETEVGVSGRRARSAVRVRGLPVSVQLADDQGTSATGQFGGGGGDQIEGVFTTTTPLSAHSAWLELTGQRVELQAHEGPPVEVRVEPLPPRPAGLAFIWHERASADRRRGHMGETDPALDALVAVGAVNPDDPEVRALRQVDLSLRPPGGSLPPGIPEYWERFLSQPPSSPVPPGNSVTAAIPVGVVAGPIDGALVAIDVIEAGADGLAMGVVVSPGSALPHPFGPTGRALEWWAEDDLGVVRLGSAGSSGGSQKKMRATIEFARGLDVKATVLRIILVGATERAVVTVPLGVRGEAQ